MVEKKFLDQNGVKYLWSQLSLEDYPNNETLIAVLNAIDQTKADKEELFSGSWNDLEDKPFGEIIGYSGTTKLFDSLITEYQDAITDDNGDLLQVYADSYGFDNNCVFYDGDSLIMTLDGEEYEAVAYDTGEEAYMSHVYRVDFEVGSILSYVTAGYASVLDFIGFEPNTQLIMSLSRQDIEYSKLDSKYLPYGIAYIDYVDTELSGKADSVHEHNELYYTEIEVNNLLNNKVNTSALDNYYNKTEVDAFHETLEDYVDNEVAALVNAAPETLDTLGELATAIQNNASVVEALDASITNKQDKISDTLILVDTVTGLQHKIQIQNGQLVSFPVE